MSRSKLNDFVFEQQLGKGSFGVVYKVSRKADHKTYVIKQIMIDQLDRSEQEDAIKEVHVLAALDCKYVIKYYDSFLDAGKLNIVMEYAANGCLHDKIKAQGTKPFEEDVVWNFFIQTALGLNHIHSKKVLHRDIKSLNIFLDADDVVKLGDLGVAKVLSTQTNFARTLVGTPYYLSPELCEDKPYNEKSDVWALGCVLYECCSLKHPFDAANQGALILKILKGKYPPVKGYSAELQDVMSRCLTRDTTLRPTTSEILSLPTVKAKAAELGIKMPDSFGPSQPVRTHSSSRSSTPRAAPPAIRPTSSLAKSPSSPGRKHDGEELAHDMERQASISKNPGSPSDALGGTEKKTRTYLVKKKIAKDSGSPASPSPGHEGEAESPSLRPGAHRDLNQLLDRCDKLREQIEETRGACLSLITADQLKELHEYLPKASEREEKQEDIHKVVFKKIPFEKAEVVTKIYHLIYLEGELEQQTELDFVFTAAGLAYCCGGILADACIPFTCIRGNIDEPLRAYAGVMLGNSSLITLLKGRRQSMQEQSVIRNLYELGSTTSGIGTRIWKEVFPRLWWHVLSSTSHLLVTHLLLSNQPGGLPTEQNYNNTVTIATSSFGDGNLVRQPSRPNHLAASTIFGIQLNSASSICRQAQQTMHSQIFRASVPGCACVSRISPICRNVATGMHGGITNWSPSIGIGDYRLVPHLPTTLPGLRTPHFDLRLKSQASNKVTDSGCCTYRPYAPALYHKAKARVWREVSGRHFSHGFGTPNHVHWTPFTSGIGIPQAVVILSHLHSVIKSKKRLRAVAIHYVRRPDRAWRSHSMATSEKKPAKRDYKMTNRVGEDHGKPIYGIAFNFCDLRFKNVFASVGSNRATVYECAAGGRVNILQAFVDEDPEEEFYCCGWACNELTGAPLLAVAGQKGIIKVIDCSKESEHLAIRGHGNSINAIKAHPTRPNLVITASKDESLRLWNVRLGICVLIFAGENGHRNEVLHLDIHQGGGHRFISGGMDSKMKIWTLSEHESLLDMSDRWEQSVTRFPTRYVHFPVLTVSTVHQNYVDCTVWLGDLVLSKSVNNSIVLWKPNYGTKDEEEAATILQEYTYTDCNIWFMRFSLDFHCNVMALGNLDGKVFVWEVHHAPPMMVAKLSTPQCKYAVRQTAVSYDSRTILVCCDDCTIWRYDLQ
eukprot:jgi/Mesvir1/944/Mv17498-RA.1